MHGFASNVLSCEERESQVVLPAAASAPRELVAPDAREAQARLADRGVAHGCVR